jgi:hypothetical protein
MLILSFLKILQKFVPQTLESMLGVVQDPAYGSFHLENLTQHYAEEAWKLMQKILALSDKEEETFLAQISGEVSTQRLNQIKTRKMVLAGINDFPDAKEALNLELKPTKFFRLARGFEALRLKMQSLAQKPKVHIALYGDYAALNARINFVKNYFELLGLKVDDPAHNHHDAVTFMSEVKNRKEDILILCASDEGYLEIAPHVGETKFKEKFLAGRGEIPGFTSIFTGQDVYSVLEGLVKRWSEK